MREQVAVPVQQAQAPRILPPIVQQKVTIIDACTRSLTHSLTLQSVICEWYAI
jgi:hypothetical protein